MNINDVLTLARAGFSAEQIAAMYTAPTNQTPATSVATAPPIVASAPVAANPDPAPAVANPAPAPAPAPAESYAESFAAIMRDLASVKNAVQNGAIMATSLPPAETVDSILASIINPKEG